MRVRSPSSHPPIPIPTAPAPESTSESIWKTFAARVRNRRSYLAAAQGGTSANKNLEILEEKMSPAQLETAQKFSREWREEHQIITRPIIPLGGGDG